MKLTNPTDEQLNEAFAEKVAEWHRGNGKDEYVGYWYDGHGSVMKLGVLAPEFTKSVDAVIPWLERSPFDVRTVFSNTCSMWHVNLKGRFTSNREFIGSDESAAKAGVIALLLSHGVEVEFK